MPARNSSGLQNPLPNTKFFSHTLKKDGWRLANVGKWHIGTDKSKPSAHGYDELPYYPAYGYPSRHPHYLDYLKNHRDILMSWMQETKDPLRVWATPMM